MGLRMWTVVAVMAVVAVACAGEVVRYTKDCESGEVVQVPLQTGDTVPGATVSTLDHGRLKLVRTQRLFRGKRVLLFSVSAAFEPGAEDQFGGMLSVYNEMDSLGVDAIVMVMASDPFANNAMTHHHYQSPSQDLWTTVSDANGVWSRKMGLVCPHSAEGTKPGIHLFAAVVDNGTIEWIVVDEGHEHLASSHANVLAYLRSTASA